MSDERSTGGGGQPRLMRVAEVFDGRGPSGGIVVDRPAVDPGELPGLTAYLTTAPVALATTKTGEDEMSPGAGLAVPRAYHTDGEWIWPAAVGYYLHRYHLPPQAELLEHIRARGFKVEPVPEQVRQAAATQMLEQLAAAKRKPAAPEDQIPEPEPGSVSSLLEGGAPGSEPQGAEPEESGSLIGPRTEAPEVNEAEPTLWMPTPVVGSPEPEPEVAESEIAAPHVTEPEVAEPEAAAPAQESVSAPEPVRRETARESADGTLSVFSFSAELTAAGNRHAAWVFEQIETFIDFMPLEVWTADHETRRYQQGEREFTVDALGRLTPDGRWIWAWAEPDAWSKKPALTESARRLRELGDRLGIKELTAPVLVLSENEDADDPETAVEMLAWTSMGLTGARGYIGHSYSDDARIYYLSFDEAIPAASPDFGAIPHFLTQGAAKFEEDAIDCVVGYIEHHGWDWSRSSGGIVVSAGDIGTFTAEISQDGQLTGVSLH